MALVQVTQIIQNEFLRHKFNFAFVLFLFEWPSVVHFTF